MHVIYQFLHDYWFLLLFSVMGFLLLNIGLNKRGLFLNNKRDLFYCIGLFYCSFSCVLYIGLFNQKDIPACWCSSVQEHASRVRGMPPVCVCV